MSGYIDGNYANAFLESALLSYPLNVPNNDGTSQIVATFVQYQNAYVSKALNSTYSAFVGYYLIENGPMEYIAPGMLRYQETYCGLPVTWTEVEQVVYTFPGRSGGTGDNWDPYYFAKPITLPRIATITHTYSLTQPSPDTITIFTDDGIPVDYVGNQNPNNGIGVTSPAAVPSTITLSSEVRLWRGGIYEKITKTITPP